MKRFTSIFTAVAVALTLMMSVMPMTVFAAYKLTRLTVRKFIFIRIIKKWRQSAKKTACLLR